MKWLLDENGNIVLRNGKPVAIGDDGQEFEYDIDLRNKKLIETIGEATKHRKEKAELKKAVESIPEEVRENPATYVEAFQTVQTMDDKSKADIEKVKTEITKSFQTAKDADTARIKDLEGQLYKEKVTTKFATSPALKETIFDGTRDVAESYFGGRFTVNEKGVLVGTNETGETIYSKEKPGEPAGFDECLSTIINSHPQRDSFISASQQKGGGKPPGRGQEQEALSSHERIKAGLAARKSA